MDFIKCLMNENMNTSAISFETNYTNYDNIRMA